jgi:hypothetical protein
MGKKLPPDQLELYKRIGEILFYKWDPIGISDTDWARDEYRSYLPKVFGMALESQSLEQIAEYLTLVTTESMGLSAARDHDTTSAKLIMDVKESLGL